jgi:Na+/phosphate symporter
VNSNDPNNFAVTNNEAEFEWLKQKVVSLHKAERVTLKMSDGIRKPETRQRTTMESSVQHYADRITEKEKEMEQLINKINQVRKGMRHNV